jgi:type VI secretion system protein ImpM
MSGDAFLFGKLPAHGDFVSRGLSEGARQAWDDWASAALEQLRAASADFDDAHGSIPPWRFVAGPSSLGEGWRIGALTPSIDSAGRRFVLVAGLDGCGAEQAGGHGLAVAAAVENILYQALGDRLAADQVIGVISRALEDLADDARAATVLAAAPRSPGAWWSPGVDVRVSAQPPADLFAAASDARARESAA